MYFEDSTKEQDRKI